MRSTIRLLGPASACNSDGDVVDASAWRTAKTFDLMRVLALTPGRPVPIPTLLELFWPSSDRVHGSTSLRTATSQIRKVLGSDSVVRVGHSLVLDAWVDVADYRDAVAEVERARGHQDCERVVALVERAEALYAGDVDVAATDCSVLHDARDELRDIRTQLLLDASEAAGRCADWRRSLDFAQRAAAIELTDRSTRAVMRAWYELGESSKPVEAFEQLRRHLAETYGVDPAPQTRALYLEVVGACDAWPPQETTVAREREIRQAVATALGWFMRSERPSGVVWLLGRAGSGRESVAREAMRTLAPLVDDTERGVDDPVAEVLPDQGRVSRGSAEMLRRRAAASGRILFVPADQASRSALHGDDAVIEVAPLDYPDFERLMSLVLQGRPTHELVDELYAESRGLPGLACRSVRSRVAAGDLTWALSGVDTTARSAGRFRLLVTTLPFALAGLFGTDATHELDARASIVLEVDRDKRDADERTRRSA